MFLEYILCIRYLLIILNPNSRFKSLGLFPFTDEKTLDLKNYMAQKARKYGIWYSTLDLFDS